MKREPDEDYEYQVWEPDDYLCETCFGAGMVSRAEYECDWVNFSDEEFMACPSCVLCDEPYT
jgi:hypothetical protein